MSQPALPSIVLPLLRPDRRWLMWVCAAGGLSAMAALFHPLGMVGAIAALAVHVVADRRLARWMDGFERARRRPCGSCGYALPMDEDPVTCPECGSAWSSSALDLRWVSFVDAQASARRRPWLLGAALLLAAAWPVLPWPLGAFLPSLVTGVTLFVSLLEMNGDGRNRNRPLRIG